MLCVRVDFVLPAVAANAVRYGIARAEWFLNIVRFFHELALQESDKPHCQVRSSGGLAGPLDDFTIREYHCLSYSSVQKGHLESLPKVGFLCKATLR